MRASQAMRLGGRGMEDRAPLGAMGDGRILREAISLNGRFFSAGIVP